MDKNIIISLGAVGAGIVLTEINHNPISITGAAMRIGAAALISGGITYMIASHFNSKHPLRTTAIVLCATASLIYVLERANIKILGD